MSFIEFLNEIKLITVYHGDNFKTNKLEPKWMNHADSNNQEGVGIYFGTLLETAEAYGKNIIKAEINHKRFINSRYTLDNINSKKIISLLKELHKLDNEPLWYLLTDYNFQISEPSKVKAFHLEKLFDKIKSQQIRHFQIDMCENFGTENFVKIWNEIIKIDGTFQEQSEGNVWYAIINDQIKVTTL